VATLICPECGLVELSGTTRCPDCGLTALDDRDFTNRNAIDEAIALRRQLAQPRWTAAALVLAGAAALLVGTALGKDPRVGEALAYPSLIGALLIGRAVGRRHLTPAWRAAIASHRHTVRDRALTRAYWTSTTVIALTICLVFVGVEIAVGIDALAFQRGDELTRPWRIATSAFSHAGPLHLLGNVVALLAFGLAIDLRIGRLATATILAVSVASRPMRRSIASPNARSATTLPSRCSGPA